MDCSHQVPLSMEFSRQGFWSSLLFPTPGDLPNPGIKFVSLAFPALAGRFFTISVTWEALGTNSFVYKDIGLNISKKNFFKKEKQQQLLGGLQ